MNRCQFLVITSLAGSLFFGEVGAFAMIKYPMSNQFNFTQTYLGSLDTVRQVGNLLGSLWTLIFPFSQPKKSFFIYNTIKCLFILAFILGKILGDQRKYFFYVFMFLIGFTKSAAFCPNLIVRNFFKIVVEKLDAQRQKFALGIWFSFLNLGDMISVLLGQLILNQLALDWSIFVLIFAGILFGIGSIFYYFIDEIYIQNQQNRTVLEQIKEKSAYMKSLLIQPNLTFVLFKLVLISVFYYNILLWFPYYFTLIGFKQYAAYISMLFPLLLVVGSFLFQYFIQFCQFISKWIIFALLFAAVLIHGCMIFVNQSSALSVGEKVIYYFVLVSFGSLFISGPFSRVGMSQLSLQTDGSEKMNYYMLSLFHLFRCFLSIFSLLFIGYFLQHEQSENKVSFLWILLLNGALFLIVDLVRNLFFRTERRQNQMQELNE